MKCNHCGKKIKSKLEAHVSDSDYPKLRMGEDVAVYCSQECFLRHVDD